MKLLLSLLLCSVLPALAGPGFFMNQQGVVATGAPVSSYTPSSHGSIAVKWWLAARKQSLSDGDSVSSFNDWSSSGINATQGTTAKQPLFKTNQIAGHPGVHADGIDDVLDVASSPVASASAATMMWVGKATYDPAPTASVSASPLGRFGSSGFSDHMTWNNGVTYMGIFSTTRPMSQDLAAAVNQWHLYTVTSRGGRWTFRVDGVEVFTTASNSFGAGATPTLFADTRNGAFYATGLLSEVVVWDGELTGTDLTEEENGLLNEYGL